MLFMFRVVLLLAVLLSYGMGDGYAEGEVDPRLPINTNNLMNSIGVVRCEAHQVVDGKRVRQVSMATATIVVPPSPNHKRGFETLLTVRHAFINEDGSLRQCEFHSHQGKSQGLPITLPQDMGGPPSNTVEYMTDDLAIVTVDRRLTRCPREQDCGKWFDAMAEKPTLEAWYVNVLDGEDYNEYSSTTAFDKYGYFIDYVGSVGYDIDRSEMVGISNLSEKPTGIGAQIHDRAPITFDRVLVYDGTPGGFWTNEKLVTHRYFSEGGTSGGPIIVGLQVGQEESRRLSIFGVATGIVTPANGERLSVARRVLETDVTSGDTSDNPDNWGVQEFHDHYDD